LALACKSPDLIDEVREGYKKFDQRMEGYTKALIRRNEPRISSAIA